MPEQDVQWTNKLPALLAGLFFILLGLFSATRKSVTVAIILILLGSGFVGYSLTIKDWCAMKGSTLGASAWGNGWGGGFDSCLRQKGWLSF